MEYYQNLSSTFICGKRTKMGFFLLFVSPM